MKQESKEFRKIFLEKTKSRIAELEQSLETTLATENQLQNLLKKSEENNAVVETKGPEIINRPESERSKLIKKIRLRQKINKASFRNSQTAYARVKEIRGDIEQTISENTCLKRNPLDVAPRKKNLEKELQKLQTRTGEREKQIKYLEN